MDITIKKNEWVCEHPKDSHFLQITNNGLDHDFVICRNCGRHVGKILKLEEAENVS